jgi:hypothetical protein
MAGNSRFMQIKAENPMMLMVAMLLLNAQISLA